MNSDWQSALNALKDSLPQAEEPAPSAPVADTPKPKGRLDILLDKKGRAGKTATIICGFAAETTDSEIEKIAATLKSRLGTGGSARGGEILIQGDRRKQVAELLASLFGFKSRII